MIKHSAGVNGCFHSVFVRANEIFDPFVRARSMAPQSVPPLRRPTSTAAGQGPSKTPERFLFRLGLSY